jgi:tetratricopeptide (TPR) repeat protein
MAETILQSFSRAALVLILGVVSLTASAQTVATQATSSDPFLKAVKVFEQGQTEEALRLFRQAARLRPNDARVANGLGNTLFSLDRLGEAAAEYRRAINLNPRLAPAHKNLGLLEYRQGHLLQAKRELELATRLSPRDAVAWHFLGLSAAAQGSLKEAVVFLRRGLELNPTDASARLALARAETDSGQRDAALADYRQLVGNELLAPPDHVAVGRALLALDDPADAATQFAFALRQRPGDEEVQRELARAQLLAGQLDEAASTVQAALPAANDRAGLLLLLGTVEEQRQRPIEAAQAYREAILAAPENPEPYLRLSWLYAGGRYFPEAEQTLREGLRFVNDSYPLKVQLGKIMAMGGHENLAVPVLEDAVAARPHDALGYTTLIIANTLLGPSDEKALATAEAALRNCPDDYLVRYLHAGLLLRRARKDIGKPGADSIINGIRLGLRESIRLNPNFPHSHYDLARLEYDAGNYTEAEHEAQAALAADASFRSALYLLGRVHLKQGRHEQGMTEMRQVEQQHREEMDRLQSVAQSLLTTPASGLGSSSSFSPGEENRSTGGTDKLK